MLLADIERNPVLNDRAHAYGRVLASAVLFGSLVSRESLAAFYRLLPRWNEYAELVEYGSPDSKSDVPGRRRDKGPCPSVFAIAWTESGSNYRRWFPDTLTTVLLLRLSQQDPIADLPETRSENKRKRTGHLECDLLSYPQRDNGDRSMVHYRLAAIIGIGLSSVSFIEFEAALSRALQLRRFPALRRFD